MLDPIRELAMEQPNDPHGASRQRRGQEYDDPHYHDDAEVEPPDNDEIGGPRKPARRQPPRRPPPRRHYPDD